MSVEVLVAPAFEPVSLTDVKAWLRVDDSNSDLVLQLLIKAMREEAENVTHRAFISRQLKLTLAGYPSSGYIELPFPPLISVDAFQYVDTDGALQTLAVSEYAVRSEREPARIEPAWQVTWPALRTVSNAVQITFTAGYAPGSPPDEAESQAVMPAALRLWMQAKVSTLFENREHLVTGTIVAALPRTFADGILDSLTIGTRMF